MELLYKILVELFYLLLVSWLVIKIRNAIFVKRKNCKEEYKRVKETYTKHKVSKVLFRVAICFLIAFAAYLIIGVAIGGLTLFMMMITLGGAAYVDTGADSSFYDFLINYTSNHFSIIALFGNILFASIHIFLIRSIYIQIMCAEALNYKK